jgi:lipopolysaccharide/colanic/teichoic acid biosynthesis glycosyltransferase
LFLVVSIPSSVLPQEQGKQGRSFVPAPKNKEAGRGAGVVNVRRSGGVASLDALSADILPVEERGVLSEKAFERQISLERKRSERSGKPFLLMKLELENGLRSDNKGKAWDKILSALSQSTRETDVTGWCKNNSVVGVLFTEFGGEDRNSILSTMITRVSGTLRKGLSAQQFGLISISFHLFPEEWNQDIPQRPSNPTLYPDLMSRDNAKKFFCVTKRIMDIVGSAFALLLFAPILLVIAIAIKLTSEGPVFFRQKRVGQFGEQFVFLKFRSMTDKNDDRVHKEYTKRLIAGNAESHQGNGNSDGVFKLTKDSRITRVGGFLRRFSLDELPQFVNVLRGEMSLVGPRPATTYEVASYDIWHRRRVLEAKPGITGPWQVNGRSRIKFADMVRLDLRYAKTWSPWMDLKILLRTPVAVVFGDDAF